MLKNLKAFQALSSQNRISSVDVFRGVAIISVVFFHYGALKLGYIGVDLFFVISGLLIGNLLFDACNKHENINFFKFIMQRGLKIWPSYYIFLVLGTLLAHVFYSGSNPDEIIPIYDMKRYLLFYQNYTGKPFHWSFDHVWSLCVEEHFYLILPLLFILSKQFTKQRKVILFLILILIAFGVLGKFLSLAYTSSKDTYSATHNRIDGLGWGVLLSYILTYKTAVYNQKKLPAFLFISGIILFITLLFIKLNASTPFFENILFHSLLPISFFLMIFGAYRVDLAGLKPLRFIAYYSYNWYLWHPLFSKFISQKISSPFLGLAAYLVVSFVFAVFFTILVEEFFLSKRKTILESLFRPRNKETGI